MKYMVIGFTHQLSKKYCKHIWQSLNSIEANTAWPALAYGIKMVWILAFWIREIIKAKEFWMQARMSWLFSNRQQNWEATAEICIPVWRGNKAQQMVSAYLYCSCLAWCPPGGLQDHIRFCFVCSQIATCLRLCRKCLCILKSLVSGDFWRKVSSHNRKIPSSLIYKNTYT